MEKKFLVTGIKNIAGKSKKTGNQFSMFIATVLEPTAVGGMVADACGYEAREIEVEEQVLRQMSREAFPVEVTAWLELNRDNKVRINSVKMSEPAKLVSTPAKAATA